MWILCENHLQQKKEMINICIDGIIKIIANCKNQELGIYIILNKHKY